MSMRTARSVLALLFGLLSASMTATIAFKPGPAAVSSSSLTASPNSVVADGNTALTLSLKVYDIYSNPVPFLAVSLAASGGNNTLIPASGSTDANGTFVFSLTSTLAQSQNVVANLGSGSVSAPVQFVAGPAIAATSSLVVNPNTQVANNSNLIVATLTLRDVTSNPVAGQAVTFSASGTSTTVATTLATTSSLGIASATYGTAVAQNQNARGVVGGLTLLAPMAFVAGPPVASASTLVANPNILAGDGNAATTLTAIARDAQGNLVSGASVSLSASGGNTTFATASGTTGSSGQYSTTVTSTQMQVETLQATFAGSVNVATQITFTGPANANTSSLALSPNSQTVGNSNGVVATLTLRDAGSNLLRGVAPTWVASGKSTTFSQSGNTTTTGTATATYQTTLAQNQNAQVTAGGINLTTPMVFVAGSPNASNSTFYALPSRQLANNSNTIAAKVSLLDAYRNPVSGQSPTFSVTGTGISISADQATNSLGLAAATMTSNVIQNTNAQVAVSGLTFTTPIFFTDVPGRCSLTASPNRQSADGNSPITLSAVVLNSNNAGAANVLTTFTSSGSASHFIPPYALTNAQGVATVQVKSSLFGINIFTAQAANVTCAAQGNFIAQTPFCSGSPNFISSGLTVGSRPKYLSVADLNQDGNMDLIVSNSNANTISVLLGTGLGAFQSQAVYATGNAPEGIAVADFNGDGLPDVAVVNYTDNTVGVFIGSGRGVLQNQITYACGQGPTPLGASDMNADGIVDLIVGNRTAGNIGVLLGTGTGTFEAQITSPATNTANNNLALVDINRDGILDVVVPNYGYTIVSVLLGLGKGLLGSPSTYTASGKNVTGIGAVDFNGDGKIDIAMTAEDANNVGILLASGTSGFSSVVSYSIGNYPQIVQFGDFNGDGYPDFVSTNEKSSTVTLYLGTGTGTFRNAISVAVGTSPFDIKLADFNNDGKLDFAVTNNSTANTVKVLLYSSCN